jgi:hypothetical protein
MRAGFLPLNQLPWPYSYTMIAAMLNAWSTGLLQFSTAILFLHRKWCVTLKYWWEIRWVEDIGRKPVLHGLVTRDHLNSKTTWSHHLHSRMLGSKCGCLIVSLSLVMKLGTSRICRPLNNSLILGTLVNLSLNLSDVKPYQSLCISHRSHIM